MIQFVFFFFAQLKLPLKIDFFLVDADSKCLVCRFIRILSIRSYAKHTLDK